MIIAGILPIKIGTGYVANENQIINTWNRAWL